MSKNNINDLHPFIERDVIRTGKNTVYHRGLCCYHDWMLGPSRYGMAALPGAREVQDNCMSCGAVAIREVRTGRIIDYTSPEILGENEKALPILDLENFVNEQGSEMENP